jgi:hypothetical protein
MLVADGWKWLGVLNDVHSLSAAPSARWCQTFDPRPNRLMEREQIEERTRNVPTLQTRQR